jgi:hypothetical protein
MGSGRGIFRGEETGRIYADIMAAMGATPLLRLNPGFREDLSICIDRGEERWFLMQIDPGIIHFGYLL